MKLVLATTALLAAISLSPAVAQGVHTQTASSTTTSDGAILIEGVSPARVLGAIDTQKLVAPREGAPLSIPETTTSITTIEAPPETARPLVNIPSVSVPLPREVARVASGSDYSTDDLVRAQLAALTDAPPIEQPVIVTTTITYPNRPASPDAAPTSR